EGLRMQSNGHAAKSFHPAKLGSKLTHPFITTDYSENLLELITEPKNSIKDALDMLRELHVLVHRSLENGELMWPLSMPCMLSADDSDIPLADYGTSNIGKLKTLYRSGLGVRYGKKMQTIAGLHYNLSVGDDLFLAWAKTESRHDLQAFKNEKYFGLIRNFKRLTPLVLYLVGASPSVCECFLEGREHDLLPLEGAQCTYYCPNATSLRMGKLGYTNSVQKDLDIRYNNLDEYIKGLRQAIDTPFAKFSRIGVDDKNGNPIQINDHILQIENEFYSPIRPKQVANSGETPTNALQSRGIAYVEFRAIDLDPYSDIGITTATACFLEVLALYCLLLPSPELLPDEEMQLADNVEMVVNHGRQIGIEIASQQGKQNLHEWIV
ncbi:MAG: glutamate--cysteine ligase, partial [Moraxella sp.]|nr:glutamate--cysteine ligase [Moraxella sp.]